MNKKILSCALLLLPAYELAAKTPTINNLKVIAPLKIPSKDLPAFSELKIGAEYITYSETLANIADLGELTQSANVVNPTLRQSSFSSLSPQWGFYIEGASTMGQSITKEKWSIGSFGEVQQNDFQVQINEVGMKFSYQLAPALQLTAGGKISTFSFTRSYFEFVQPGAKAVDDALLALGRTDSNGLPSRFLLPGQSPMEADVPQDGYTDQLRPVVSISENQLSILATAGIKYDSFFRDPTSHFTWFAESEVSTPVYNLVTTTQVESASLTEYFNGWGVAGKIGARYHINKEVALIVGIDADYQTRMAITSTLNNGARIRVPDIVYTNTAFYGGIFWAY